MRKLILLTLSTSAFLTQAYAESALSFVDLRVQGGLAQTDGQAGSLTLMAGDIGNKDQHVLTLDADMGVVIGLRGSAINTSASREDTNADLDLKLGGGAFVGGLGFYLGKHTHMELLGGYGQGIGTATGDTFVDNRDTQYKMYLAELGVYYTYSSGIQLGVIVGGSILKAVYDDLGTDVKAETKGFDGSVALGYRF